MLTKFLLIILAIILSLLQATILSINLLLLLVVGIAFYQPEFSFFFAFLAGLILALVKGETLGIASLKFLLIAFLIFLLRIRLAAGEKRKLKLPSIQ